MYNRLFLILFTCFFYSCFEQKNNKIEPISLSKENNEAGNNLPQKGDTAITKFFGEWIPYKNEPCDYLEKHDFESYMRLKVYIYPNKTILFNDTVDHPVYKLGKEEATYIRFDGCVIAMAKLNINTDSINILTVGSGVDFIISGKNNLIVQDGQGVMFFLKKVK